MKTTPRASSGESASSAAAIAPSPLIPASAPPTTQFGTDLCVRPVRVPAARPRADVLTEGLHAPQRQACVQGVLQAKLRELRTHACHWGAWSKLHTGFCQDRKGRQGVQVEPRRPLRGVCRGMGNAEARARHRPESGLSESRKAGNRRRVTQLCGGYGPMGFAAEEPRSIRFQPP